MIDRHTTYLESFEGEGAAEIGVGVLRVLSNDSVEVSDGFFVLIYHLIGLCPLVEEAQVTRNSLQALLEWED